MEEGDGDVVEANPPPPQTNPPPLLRPPARPQLCRSLHRPSKKSGASCTALSTPLGGHLAFTAQEHEALSMLRMAGSMHLFQRALLRMPRRCTQWDLRTVRQQIMPYCPQATIIRSTTGRNRVAAQVPLQSIVHNAISMAQVIGKPPPLAALPLLSFQGMRLPCGRHPLPVRMYGSMYAGGQSTLRR